MQANSQQSHISKYESDNSLNPLKVKCKLHYVFPNFSLLITEKPFTSKWKKEM